MTKYVAGFAFSLDMRRLLLIKKQKPKWQRGLLNGIGGKVEGKETPDEAIAREFNEEAGLSTDKSVWTAFCHLSDMSAKWDVTFFTSMLAIENAKTMECERVVRVNPRKLPANVIDNLRWLVPMAMAKSRVQAFVSEV